MLFKVKEVSFHCPSEPRSQFYLIKDNWDDWFEYNTLYNLYYIDEKGKTNYIGGVKIGQFGMIEGQKRPGIPEEFNTLSKDFFSLGQDVSYYERLNNLGEDIRHKVLSSLKDFALNQSIYIRAKNENVTKVSLLRSVSKASVTGQFKRLANGDATLTKYRFTYQAAKNEGQLSEPMQLNFKVTPESNPPTNVHTLIGRNGVGKTRLINNMIKSLLDSQSKKQDVGSFSSELTNDPQELFASVVSVTFSAFDSSEPLKEQKNKEGIQYNYIGLKRERNKDGEEQPPKSYKILNQEFVDSIKACLMSAKIIRWRRAIKMLETDPVFKEVGVENLINYKNESDLEKTSSLLFEKLSSGHKIVLLTITRLVQTVEEKTLVLLDEPEGHLHPPLLSAFTRALSDLLIQRNGVAIIATHSPVVLQEVPKSCVWKLRRTGSEAVAERLEIESFGENIGTLTKEVFGLEVTESGFHSLLKQAVRDYGDFDSINDYFNGELGMEAQGIIRALIAIKNSRDDKI
ncbi:hypothetical protein BTR22_19030 [Alkalihalophilus pseudofirmus]|uniref:AAA family ATPase n=1 Tax=Alkalihalophilus pseudofirmus TaxID=79885 RepID=UPI00095211E2|nr:hypothetical protein BTR22_19030 [Alkalihalophilus pseudofirmus]